MLAPTLAAVTPISSSAWAKSADDLRQQRDAIAEWSRLSYGWMGRTPDYKARSAARSAQTWPSTASLSKNARNWYTQTFRNRPVL